MNYEIASSNLNCNQKYTYASASTNTHNNTVLAISDFSKWLNTERIKQNLTQKQLAKKSKISVSTIQKLESEDMNLTLVTCIRLTYALGYNMSMSHGHLTIEKIDE